MQIQRGEFGLIILLKIRWSIISQSANLFLEIPLMRVKEKFCNQ